MSAPRTPPGRDGHEYEHDEDNDGRRVEAATRRHVDAHAADQAHEQAARGQPQALVGAVFLQAVKGRDGHEGYLSVRAAWVANGAQGVGS